MHSITKPDPEGVLLGREVADELNTFQAEGVAEMYATFMK